MAMNSTTRREFIMTAAGAVGAGLALARYAKAESTENKSASSAVGLKASPLKTVRVAFIGVGARGGAHLSGMMELEGVEVTAICDNHAPTLEKALASVAKKKRPAPAAFGKGDDDYKRMLERNDIDIVIISTPWELHTRMCVDTMKAGKHAFVEVPAAVTVDECWELVDTAERTQKHCMMLEYCCYGQEELAVLNMCRLGVFGELLHGEGAYLHDLREQMNDVEHGTGSWRTSHYIKRNGNLYPTHGLGHLAQYMSINRGDKFDYLTTVASPAIGRALYAKEHFKPDHKWNQVKQWNCGDINTTLIKTARGRSIMVQFNETSPEPYSRINRLQGTKGVFAGYPNRLVIEGETHGTHEWVEGDKLKPFFDKYDHPLWKKMGEIAKHSGGHGGMDFLLRWRLVQCLRNGEPLDQDVYDAASWSVIGPISEKSIANRSNSVDVPDFTRGRWTTTPPLGIVS